MGAFIGCQRCYLDMAKQDTTIGCASGEECGCEGEREDDGDKSGAGSKIVI